MAAAQGRTASAVPAGARTATLTVVDPSFVVDPALALLQQHQLSQITAALVTRAEQRLAIALHTAQASRPVDPALLLRQVMTDLGVTLDLP